MTKKEKMRANWMANFDTKVLELNPKLAGKICWNTATYFYNSGLTYQIAAIKYTINTDLNII